jgi:hypothetical protein
MIGLKFQNLINGQWTIEIDRDVGRYLMQYRDNPRHAAAG